MINVSRASQMHDCGLHQNKVHLHLIMLSRAAVTQTGAWGQQAQPDVAADGSSSPTVELGSTWAGSVLS